MVHQIDLSRVDLNLLVVFETVMETRHVGQAASRLHLSSPAVSHALGRLRRLLDDPLFVRTPRGVVPTDRARALAEPIAELLALARGIVATAAPFDPATSTRRYTIGAPDGVSAVVLGPLFDALRVRAPGVDVALRQLLPTPGEVTLDRAWRFAFAELEAQKMDVAILPLDAMPPRFHRQSLYHDDFVVVARNDHPFVASPTLENYCAANHLVVSQSGDPYGFVDQVLAEKGLSRRIALTVPNFMFALAVAAETDLLAALPRRFAALYARRQGVVVVDAPLPFGHFELHAIAPRAAMTDTGLAWFFDLITRASNAADR